MLRRRLRELIDAYRWLWQAQRRWQPGPRWLAVPRFLVRVLADMLRTPMARTAIVVLLLVAGGGVVALGRLRDAPSGEPAATRWALAGSGVDLSFPTGWRAVRPSQMRHAVSIDLSPVVSSTYSKDVGGSLLGRRSLSAQIYELGAIPPGVTTYQMALAASTWIPAPHYALGKPSRMESGAFVSAFRLDGSEATMALIVVRGRNSNGFVIGVTGDRDDEGLLLGEAHVLAAALRHDGRVLSDPEIFLHAYLEIPPEAGETIRHRLPALEEQVVSDERLIVSARLAEAATVEECRAGIAPIWMDVLGPFLAQRHRRGLWAHEVRLSCPSSSVRMIYDLREHDFFVRQYDETGTLVYEKDMTEVVYQPRWGGSSIS